MDIILIKMKIKIKKIKINKIITKIKMKQTINNIKLDHFISIKYSFSLPLILSNLDINIDKNKFFYN